MMVNWAPHCYHLQIEKKTTFKRGKLLASQPVSCFWPSSDDVEPTDFDFCLSGLSYGGSICFCWAVPKTILDVDNFCWWANITLASYVQATTFDHQLKEIHAAAMPVAYVEYRNWQGLVEAPRGENCV